MVNTKIISPSSSSLPPPPPFSLSHYPKNSNSDSISISFSSSFSNPSTSASLYPNHTPPYSFSLTHAFSLCVSLLPLAACFTSLLLSESSRFISLRWFPVLQFSWIHKDFWHRWSTWLVYLFNVLISSSITRTGL